MWHVALLLGMALAQGGNIDVEFITWGMPQHEGLHDVSVVGPATEFALQELHKDLQPAVDFKQTFIMNNSWTSCKDVDADMSARLSEYYYKRQAVPSATILVAGGCEERRKVNELAANWNILYFTSGYNDPVIHEKDITPTWISVEPFNRDSLVRRTVDVLHFFKWSTIFIITTEHTAAFCLDVRDEVVRLMSKTLDKFQYSQATIDLDSPHSRISWCQQVRVSSRVVVVLTLAAQFRQVMIIAASCNLTHGDYVFLLHKYPDENSNTSWAYGDKYDETARIAFRAALVLEDIPPSAKDMTEQDMPVDRLRRASRERYNVTWTTPPLRLMPTYEAIMVLGSVLKTTLVAGDMEVLRDGSALKQRIANCRFQLKSGWVEFNEFGERVIDPSLLFFNPETDDFEPATVFDAPGNFSIQLRRPWFNQNALPTNEPLCGYQAQKCDHQADSTVPNVAIASSIAAVLLVVSLFTYMGMQYRIRHADWWLRDPNALQGNLHPSGCVATRPGKAQVAA